MLARRISLTLTCYYWSTEISTLFQVILFIIQGFAYLWYLFAVMPFKESFLNKLEIFNEVVTLIVGYHLLTFTEMNQDRFVKKILGYTMIGFCLFNMMVNLTLVIKAMGTEFMLWARKKIKGEDE